MLDTELKDQLKLHLDYLPRPIEITAALDDGADSGALRSLLDDIASASDKIRIVELKGADPGGAGGNYIRRPSFAIHPPGEQPRVRFAGLPFGPDDNRCHSRCASPELQLTRLRAENLVPGEVCHRHPALAS